MKLSASQAAKQVGKSVPTITRYCKAGKLSHEVVDGGFLIDTSELFRLFDPVTPESDKTPKALGGETTPETASEMAVLRVENRMLREQVGDLRSERDKWQEQAARLSITAANPQPDREAAQVATGAAIPLPDRRSVSGGWRRFFRLA